jgi:cytoskeleton protein RodZ
MTTNAQTNTVAPAATHGPGAQLAQARTDSNLTHEAVAAKLHLASHQIQALEQDDYSSLPGTTYVRGYLKSYALLLGLSPGPILEAHSRLTAAPAAVDFSVIAPRREITSRHHQVRFVTYFMVAIVIGLAIAWWQGRDTRAPNPLLTAGSSESTLPLTDVVSGAAQQTGSDQLAIDISTSQKSENITNNSNQPIVPLASQTPVAAVSLPVSVPQPAAAVTDIDVLPTSPRVKLVLTAEQESWADIRDARQTKLLYETVPAGRTVILEGVAPVSVFLGNAAGVRLDYNGKSVDVGVHKRGMIARFTLGESDAASIPVR